MTSLILAYDTALAYWSRKDAAMPQSTLSPASADQALASTAGTLASPLIRRMRKQGLFAHLPYKLDLLVGRPADHRSTDEAMLRCLETRFPPRSLVRISSCDDIQVLACSPELLFVQMARFMELAELIELGFELCGQYAMAPATTEGMIERPAVSTPQRIARYLEDASGLTGAKRARTASRFVLANSKSPKESQLAMLATLDRRYGGFAIEAPLLNHSIALPDAAQEVVGQAACRPDLYWPGIETAIEYDSNAHHVGSAEGERDARRRTGYKLSGIDAITITYGQMSSLSAIASVLDMVSRRFGYKRPVTKTHLTARSLLHRTLLFGKRRPRHCDSTPASESASH